MGAGSSTSRTTSSNNNEKKKKVAKIPLNIALVAIVKIQTRYRMRMARERFEEIREIVMEERRLAELQRAAEEEENAEEESPMITSSMQGSTKNPSMNHRNRFMRKVLPAERLAALAEEDTFGPESSFDPSAVVSKYSPVDGDSVVIYPLVGFVVKSRSNITGKKIFLNICHHEAVMTMETTAVREITDSTAAVFSRDMSSSLLPTIGNMGRPATATSMMSSGVNNNSSSLLLGAAANTMIQIGDVILPSPEYEECFSYDEDLGMVPIDGSVRQEIARQAIKFWNITHQEDISDACTFPKMKRGYFGDILPLKMNLKTKSLNHLPSALKASLAALKDNKSADEALTSFSISTKDSNHERFLLPYATELRSWVDLSSMRTRKEMEGSSTPTAATAHALAVVEHVTAPKLSNHSVKFSSRRVTSGTVELITPRIYVPQVPLFGPAYAAELMATLAPPVAPVLPVIASARNGVAASFSDTEATNIPSPTSPMAAVSSLLSQKPGQSKQNRSATMGPGTAGQPTAPVSGTPDNSNKSGHRMLSLSLSRNKGPAGAQAGGGLNLESLEESDENSRSFNLSAMMQPTAPATPNDGKDLSMYRGGKEQSVHRTGNNKDTSASRIANNKEMSMGRANNKEMSIGRANNKEMSIGRANNKELAFQKSTPQQSGRFSSFDSPSKSSPQSQHFTFANMGFSEPTEFPTIIPVFVVLSQGMLYVYNRDPTRGTYYPYSNNPTKKLASVPSTGSLNTARGINSHANNTSKAVNKHEYRPLIEYARIMLTEDCVTTSHLLTQTSTTFFLHFHAPLANKVAPEDTMAVLYTHFSDVVPGGNVSIQLRSFSELRTWKAHLRSHIQAGTAARRRVIADYIGNTMINKSFIGRKLTPKSGEVQCLQFPDQPKVFVKIEHGLLQIYDEKVPTEQAGKNLIKAVHLMDKMVNVRQEPQKDNSTNIILSLEVAENSVFSRGVDADEMYEFVFHKSYAMDESDSRDYSEFLQRNIQLAQNRYRAYMLPLLEHKQGVAVINSVCDITTVKLTVGTGDDMDSDDEDDDETEEALKKHTLLSIYYIAHPSPDEEVKRKAELSVAPPPTSANNNASTNAKDALPATLYASSGSFSEPARGNNNAEDSAADVNNAKLSAQAAHHDENKTATEDIMNKLQKNIGEVPTFDVVLTNQMLYFFHDMRYHFSLNLTRCGDKPAFRRAKAVEKLEVSKLRAKLLKEQQKASVFYLDSSSDSEDSNPGIEEEGSAADDDNDDARSVVSVNINPRGNLTRALSTASMNGGINNSFNGGLSSLGGALSAAGSNAASSNPSPVPTAAPPPLAKTKSSVGRNPRVRPVKSIDAAAPPVSASDKSAQDKVVLAKAKGGKVLPESKAPPNYPITAWCIQLVSFDNRVYTLKFKTAEEYHNWREMLFFVGNEAVDPLFPLSNPAASALQPRNSISVPNANGGFTLSKEDSLLHPETTNSAYGVASTVPGSGAAAAVSIAAKTDAKYVDVEATKKFARLLRKDEKVLTAGQVLKHDSVAVSKINSIAASTAPKPRRILVLTDAPRLLFLDPVGNIVRGNLELSNEGPVEVKMSTITDFDVIISNTVNRFTSTDLPEKNAVFWTTKIKQALTMR